MSSVISQAVSHSLPSTICTSKINLSGSYRIGNNMVKCPYCRQDISSQEINTERFTGEDDDEYVAFSCPSCEILLGIQKG